MDAFSAPNPGAKDSIRAPVLPPQPKLLDRLRRALTANRYREETVDRLVEWSRRLIVYHGRRHPETLSGEGARTPVLVQTLCGFGGYPTSRMSAWKPACTKC
jgi:hypothetical protein